MKREDKIALDRQTTILPWCTSRVVGVFGDYVGEALPRLRKDAACIGVQPLTILDANMFADNSLKFVQDVYSDASPYPTYRKQPPRRDGPIEFVHGLRQLADAMGTAVLIDLRFASKARIGTIGQGADFMVTALESNRYFQITREGMVVPFSFPREGTGQ